VKEAHNTFVVNITMVPIFAVTSTRHQAPLPAGQETEMGVGEIAATVEHEPIE
jgi:hypothetical protein